MRHRHCWTLRSGNAERGFCNHRVGRRARGDGRMRWRRGNYGRRLPDRGHDFARLGTRRGSGMRRGGGMRRDAHSRRSSFGGSQGWNGCRGPDRSVAPAGSVFRFLLFGQYGLHHVAGLGDVRQVNLGLNALRRAVRSATPVAGTVAALKVHADFFRLVRFQGAGVGLAGIQAELRQYVKNLPTLDFHLACEIVDSYLTHPPLFRLCYPKPLVAHSYLVALAAACTSIIT
jgi:hypothetical protein